MKLTIQEMVYQFKMESEKVDSQQSTKLEVPQIILVLNTAMITLVLEKYDNPMKMGFETTQKRKKELQHLIVPDKTIKDPEQLQHKGLSFNISELDPEVLFFTRVQFVGIKEGCQAVLDGIDTQSDDLNLVNRSSNKKASFEWREVPFRLADNKIIAETDNTFKLTECLPEYIRYPKPMDMKGYKKFDGSESTDQDCELPGFLHSELITYAVYKSDLWRRNPDVQFSQQAMSMRN